MDKHTGAVTSHESGTTITATMVINLFDTEVTLKGIYSDAATRLYGTVKLSDKEEGLVKKLKEYLPDLIRSVIPDIKAREVSVSLIFNREKGIQYYSVGGIISVENRKIKFSLFQKDKATLLSIHLPDPISLKGLPLVGEYMSEEDGIADLQLVYYHTGETSDQTFDELPEKPAVLVRYPQYKAAIRKGINIFASVRIGDFNTPVAYPLQALEDKTPAQIKQDKNKQTKPEGEQTKIPDNKIPSSSFEPEAPKKKFLAVKKTALVYKDGRIGFLVSGSVSISVFELEVIGLQVLAELGIFQDFSFKKLLFDLEGLSIDIQKPPLSITGAFLRSKSADNDTDYFGLLHVGIRQFQFTAIGAYSKKAEYTSIFVYAFIGLPLGGPPFFFVTGLAFGFGINRDFILPDISKINQFPLLAVCMDKGTQGAVSPPANNRSGALEMLQLLGTSIPPAPGSYFLVAGIRFESFKIIRTIALAVVKLGHEPEINLLGISSLSLPSVYAELAFSVQFAPARGIFMARGLLTTNSYVLFPGLKLTGGFAVGFWFSGDHAGDFVISMGGYHPRYKPPPHFPDNIPRIGLYGKLDEYVTLSGELYFALTPQAIMAGLFISVVYSDNWLYASISLRADFIVLWKPFYYEADIAVDVYVRFTIGKGFLSKDFSFHLHAGILVWGPEFSGKAFLDAGIKTFKISFGASAPRSAPNLTWNEFRSSFIPAQPCSINISAGLVNKVSIRLQENSADTEVWIINPKELELTTDAFIPATNAKLNDDSLFGDAFPVPGIAPMGQKTFEAEHKITIYSGWGNGKTIIKKGDVTCKFQFERLTKNLPKAMWGTEKPDTTHPPDGNDGLMKGLLTGIKITTVDATGGTTRDFEEMELAYTKTSHTVITNVMKGHIKKESAPVEKTISHAAYATAAAIRNQSLDILSEILPKEIPEVSDISGSIPVYTYTEAFIETQLFWNT